MRIIFTTRVVPHYRIPLYEEIQRRGHSLTVVHYAPRDTSGKVVSVVELPFPTRRFVSILPFALERQGLYYSPTYVDWVIQQRADLYVMEGESNFLANLAIIPYLWQDGRPYVWHTLGRLPEQSRPSSKRRLLMPLLQDLRTRAQRVVTYSSHGRQALIEEGQSADRTFVAHNALSLPPGYDAASHEDRADELVRVLGWEQYFRLGYVGALRASKHPVRLVDAAAEVQARSGIPVGVIYVGDGPEDSAIRSQAKARGVAVHFAGRQLDASYTYIKATHFIVVPGLGGLAINHAMMAGRPVVAGPADGTERDLIVEGVTGHYLPTSTPARIADVLIPYATDVIRASRLGANAHRHVNAIATIPHLVDVLLGSPS